LFVKNGLLNRARLKLDVEARALAHVSPEEMFDWKGLENYLLNGRKD
jgi:hypothetical protein